MTNPQQHLTFLAWCRPAMSSLITAHQAGRAAAAAPITLTALDASGHELRREKPSTPFLIAGPADVTGLLPGAIVRRYPAPHTTDHESDRCAYIELADPTLPWRYTPAPPTSTGIHPWLVLLTGTADELVIDNGMVTVSVSAQQDPQTVGAPADPYRYAHVQIDAVGHRVTRILSARRLQAGTDYLAVVVPAFDISGAPAWDGTAAATLPVYDSWQFHTAVPAGSFEDLADKLTPSVAPDTTGHVTLAYPRVTPIPEVDMVGTLAARTPGGTITETPLPQAVADDLDRLRQPTDDSGRPLTDERGRPVLGLPRYGEAWSADAPTSTWGGALNADPRHRGAAGLGAEIGIRRQEDLVDDVLAHLGDLHESRQRVRHLALGVEATRALWQRRMPADDAERLWVLGPALNRMITDAGPVGQLATADDRTMARGSFSAAARRVLRPGPARTGIPPRPASTLLASANRPSPVSPSGISGLPLNPDEMNTLNAARRTAVQQQHVDVDRLSDAVTELTERASTGTSAALRSAATALATSVHQATQARRAVPWAPVIAALAAADPATLSKRANPAQARTNALRDMSELRTMVSAAQVDPDDADLIPLLAAQGPLPRNDPVERPLALDTLASGVSAAFDPTVAKPPAAVRVWATIKDENGGDPPAPLTPPEPCVGLDRPAWADLAEEFSEWLLPGLSGLDDNAVAALQTNPRFIDAYLIGLNTQLLSELRWRNIPIATGCIPIRRFWDRSDTTTSATAGELMIVVRGELLRRYPTTLVYLHSAVHPPSSTANFNDFPDVTQPRLLPAFRGRLDEQTVFFGFPELEYPALKEHWLVLEEPPAGYRFRNDLDPNIASTITDGHIWAAEAFVEPVRVLIQGDSLVPGSHP